MIIGLAGGKGAGKSTVARCIRYKFGYKILSFAQPIKDMLISMGLQEYDVNDPDLKEIVNKEFTKSPRYMMQSLGSEWGRALISDRIWITCLERRMAPYLDYVIDDVRFENEAEFIRSKGGKIIHVERHKLGTLGDLHISEAGIPEEFIDKTIKNLSPYGGDLENVVVSTMEEINGKRTVHP